MVANRLTTLLASLALAGVYASPCTASPTITSAPPAPTSSCLPSDAVCGLELEWAGGFFAFKEGLASPEQCLEFCNAPRTWGVCKSFTFNKKGTCRLSLRAAADRAREQPGSGDYVWDKECWECGELGPIDEVPTRTTSAVTAVSTCLSPTAKCEIEAVRNSNESIAHWGKYLSGSGPDEGPLGCWELCTDARRPPRCKSFTWDPETGDCLFYDYTADESHVAAPGSGLWLWDLQCWTCGVTGYI